jgi:cytochrome c-type biogenesis protein CcmE
VARKTKIVAVLGLIAAVGLIIAVASLNTRPYLDVSQVAQNPSAYNGQEIQVIGHVQDYAGSNFNLTNDLTGAGYMIHVDVGTTTIPLEMNNTIRVVIVGVFRAPTMTIEAKQILSQCSN